MQEDSAYDISVATVSGQAPGSQSLLYKAIEEALGRHRVRAASIHVALVDDAHIARLNERHLKNRGPTDVLSFDLRNSDGGQETDRVRVPVDGQIVVSVDTAAREARGRGHSLEAEIALYAVHGTLHLLGYDDRNEEEAARMHEVEDEILTACGLGVVYGVQGSS